MTQGRNDTVDVVETVAKDWQRPVGSYLVGRLARLAAKLPGLSERRREKFIRSALKREFIRPALNIGPTLTMGQVKIVPKIAVFISGEAIDRPGFEYRIARYAAAFRALGFTTLEISYQQASKYPEEIATAEFVFIWRAAWGIEIQNVIHLARSSGTKLIYDLDDLMVRPDLVNSDFIDAIRYDKKDPKKVMEHYDSIRRTQNACDFGTAPTAELAWQMRRAKPFSSSLVLPNGYSDESYTRSRIAARARPSKSDGIIRIGYASGSRTHQADFNVCADIISDVLRENSNTRLVLFRLGDLVTLDLNEFPAFRGLESQIEWREFVPHSHLPNEVARFDINLAPLQFGNPFCEAKSELKFFEAAIADVPTVASPTGPFKGCIDHGKTGLLAASPSDWRAAVQNLVDDEALRTEMGRAAHLAALWRYGPKRRVELAKTLTDLLSGGRAAARSFYMEAIEQDRPQPLIELEPNRIVYSSGNDEPAKVSIIIPLYNYQDLVTEALDSAYHQTLQNIELIVVNDASTDASGEMVLRWMKEKGGRFNRCVLVEHEVNSGLGASRNTAFQIADCLHIMALDADNKLLPSCCERLLGAAEDVGAAFAYPLIRQFGDADVMMGKELYDAGTFMSSNLVDAMALISKEAWAHVGGYTTHRLGWQDYDLWCRFVDRGLIGTNFPEILAEYRVHGNSMLRTSTDKTGNKLALLDWMEAEHPWLSLIGTERDGHRHSNQSENLD